MEQTKKLKKINVTAEKAIKFTEEITRILEQIKKKEGEIETLVKEAIKRGLFPKRRIAEHKNNLLLLRYFYKDINDTKIKKRIEKLDKEIDGLNESRGRALLKYDLAYNEDTKDFEPLNPVMLIKPANNLDVCFTKALSWVLEGKEGYAYLPKGAYQKNYESYIKNNYLNLRIDLEFDLNDIVPMFKRAVATAQKIIGAFPEKGKPKGAADREQREAVIRIFFENHNGKKNAAIDNTVAELKKKGVNISSDAARKIVDKHLKEHGPKPQKN